MLRKIVLVAFLALQCIASSFAEPAPGYSLSTANGTLDLASLRGKVVYLDFWASWCSPCRKSFPWMNKMQARYGGKGLVVVAVNVDSDSAQARQFLETYPAGFTVAFDPDGKMADLYQVKGMPSSYLIDRNGEIRMKHIGFRDKNKQLLETEIQRLVID